MIIIKTILCVCGLIELGLVQGAIYRWRYDYKPSIVFKPTYNMRKGIQILTDTIERLDNNTNNLYYIMNSNNMIIKNKLLI